MVGSSPTVESGIRRPATVKQNSGAIPRRLHVGEELADLVLGLP